ncbi:MAG: phosphatase PAP2 family protein [Candidatus Pacebacteria bacterium]|nr:phosphatase PAP2 family protein [Candidatus Paceibacterota bacterium]
MQNLNNNIFYFFYELGQQSAFVADFAILLSYLTYPILGAIFIWSVFFAKRKFLSFSILFLTTITTWLVAHTFKFLFQTVRPFVELGIKPLVFESGYAFPSEHTAVFFAVAFATLFLSKKVGRILLVLAIFIALSRIVLGVHYPGDILGGFALGYFVSYLYIKLFKKLY